jgi:hypothetical protein
MDSAAIQEPNCYGVEHRRNANDILETGWNDPLEKT